MAHHPMSSATGRSIHALLLLVAAFPLHRSATASTAGQSRASDGRHMQRVSPLQASSLRRGTFASFRRRASDHSLYSGWSALAVATLLQLRTVLYAAQRPDVPPRGPQESARRRLRDVSVETDTPALCCRRSSECTHASPY